MVVAVDGDEVDPGLGPGRSPWPARRAGRRGCSPASDVGGRLHLVADDDVLPGRAVGGLEQVHGSSYVVRGRVLDTRAGRVVLELDDRIRLRVETGPHRIRADIRDPTEVRGTLCFTPTRG